MLRITTAEDSGARVLRLEGALTAKELPLLDAALREGAGRTLALDLSSLRWIDAQAAARLRALNVEGAALRSCSPFLARLLSLAPR